MSIGAVFALIIALTPTVTMVCVHWKHVPGTVWQKVLVFGSVPVAVPVVLLLTGAHPETAAWVGVFFAPVPIIGLIVGEVVGRGVDQRKAAKTCLVTTVVASFLAPWAIVALADNLYYQHSSALRPVRIRSFDGPVAVPVAYLDWQERNLGEGGLIGPAHAASIPRGTFLWLRLDQLTLEPWREDLWSSLGRTLDGRAPLRMDIAIGSPSLWFDPKATVPRKAYEARRAQIADWSQPIADGWFTVCGQRISEMFEAFHATPTQCERWPTDPDLPVLYMYRFEPVAGLDQAKLDSAVSDLLRSIGVPGGR